VTWSNKFLETLNATFKCSCHNFALCTGHSS